MMTKLSTPLLRLDTRCSTTELTIRTIPPIRLLCELEVHHTQIHTGQARLQARSTMKAQKSLRRQLPPKMHLLVDDRVELPLDRLAWEAQQEQMLTTGRTGLNRVPLLAQGTCIAAISPLLAMDPASPTHLTLRLRGERREAFTMAAWVLWSPRLTTCRKRKALTIPIPPTCHQHPQLTIRHNRGQHTRQTQRFRKMLHHRTTLERQDMLRKSKPTWLRTHPALISATPSRIPIRTAAKEVRVHLLPPDIQQRRTRPLRVRLLIRLHRHHLPQNLLRTTPCPSLRGLRAAADRKVKSWLLDLAEWTEHPDPSPAAAAQTTVRRSGQAEISRMAAPRKASVRPLATRTLRPAFILFCLEDCLVAWPVRSLRPACICSIFLYASISHHTPRTICNVDRRSSAVMPNLLSFAHVLEQAGCAAIREEHHREPAHTWDKKVCTLLRDEKRACRETI
ncbi:hypothetical protein IE81DRAFT_194305 [Ceraceosorus guamensis]|uniref:Uncharacterized protein n=1 Tax=Ceraceosorus guamensis TaxID=1522189 RepID=A0A316W6H6_9BASI|nr:hypothetical protein IE81DRAFT_194305 [Ceraceosorus guamensis]PWN45530.1 hypothetical protein IE81DRAFT_194305 [Ceraceosorus guamensis]